MSSAATVGSYEAKTHLPALLERVQAGERITITKHGVPVAILVPAGKQGKKDIREVIAQLKAFGRGRKLPDRVTVRDLIAEGRRG
jgi:prevent-host-death family protein